MAGAVEESRTAARWTRAEAQDHPAGEQANCSLAATRLSSGSVIGKLSLLRCGVLTGVQGITRDADQVSPSLQAGRSW